MCMLYLGDSYLAAQPRYACSCIATPRRGSHFRLVSLAFCAGPGTVQSPVLQIQARHSRRIKVDNEVPEANAKGERNSVVLDHAATIMDMVQASTRASRVNPGIPRSKTRRH